MLREPSRPGGGTAIIVPAGTRTPNPRRHLVCRGLTRRLYRQPGHRTGRIDHSTTTEQEIEYTALFLGRHVDNAQQGRRRAPELSSGARRRSFRRR
ncbi:hypothetical protein AB0L02_07595 [Streptomyces anulatus]|uniref:hypothetical protein n=1 Tax=Streptomyces anulatus TaxID=1892 RepID=UPI003419CCAD